MGRWVGEVGGVSVYSVLLVNRPDGKKSEKRRAKHFMERGRRPRKRRDPKPRRDRQTGNQKKRASRDH